MKKIGLALCGGGVLGAYQAGILFELSRDISFTSISGSSIGAVNACLLLGGGRDTLYDFWHDVGEDMIDSLPSFLKMGTIFYTGSKNFTTPRVDFWNIFFDGLYVSECTPLVEAINKRVDFEKINKMKEPELHICATDILLGTEEIFSNKDINIDNLTASFSIPEVFPFKQIDNKWYWDGAYTRNPSIMPLIENKVEEIWVIRLLPEKGKIPKSKEDLKQRMNEIIFSTPLRIELEFVEKLNKLCEKVPELKKEYQPIKIIETSLDIDMEVFSPLMATKNFITELFLKGRKEADIFLAKD